MSVHGLVGVKLGWHEASMSSWGISVWIDLWHNTHTWCPNDQL